jgi:hypothetical protein
MRELSGRSGDVGILFPAKTTSSPVAIRFLIILAAEAAEDEEENNNGGGGGAAADAAWRRQLPVRSSMMLSIGSGARRWCWCDSFAKRGLAAARSLCSRDKSSDSVAADVSEDMVVVVVVVVGGSISKRDGGLGRGAGAFR